MERNGSLLDDYVLSLLDSARPRVCFLPTASGDADHYVVRFYRRFSASCQTSHVSLFRRDQGVGGVEDELARHLLAQDLIYVGGGNVVSLLGTWRAHGLDEVLRSAWRKGIVLCGPSAGSLCWFREALSEFHGTPRRVRGLGLLPYSNCVHYDAEPTCRIEYQRLIGDGMRGGFAAEDGVGLHFCATRLQQAVSSRPDAAAYRVEPTADGVRETRLKVCYLGTEAQPSSSAANEPSARSPGRGGSKAAASARAVSKLVRAAPEEAEPVAT